MTHVIVIGGGNAGLAAAIHATDNGARVTIVEKSGELGGALWYTSHAISGAGTGMQERKGIVDSPQAHYDDIWRIGHGLSDPEILRVATENSGAAINWLESIGVPFTATSPILTQSHALYSNPRTHAPEPVPGVAGSGAGRQVLRAFQREITDRQADGRITVRYRTKAEELLLAGDRVRGVRVSTVRGDEEILGDAVILATGSYGSNVAMLERYIPDFPDGVISICPPEAQGDGIVLAEQAGAALVNMDMYVIVAAGVPDPRMPRVAVYWIMVQNARRPALSGDIWVNRRGERFINEDEERPDPREAALMAQPGCEMFLIFDQPMREGLHDHVRQAMAAQFEGKTPNLITSAGSIEELAECLGIPPATLGRTVDDYNRAVATGNDPLGRTVMPKAIDTPPFHAIKAAGTLFLTHGGVKINANAQVVRTDGTTFPNLYAAGDVMGAAQVTGRSFAGGQGTGVAHTFGMIAGRNAARRVKSEE